MPEIITGSVIVAGWKTLGSLYDKYQSWSLRKSKSKKAKALKERAEELMKKINSQILSGANSDDPDLAPVIKEFLSLLEQEAKPLGYERTQEWIARSKKVVLKKAAAKPAPKAAKKAAAKPVPKKAVAKKAAAKPVPKKAVAKKAVAKKSLS